MPVLVVSSSGASVVQSDPQNVPYTAIAIPVVIAAIALLVLVGLVYSRYRGAISVVPISRNIDEPEKPKMWEVYLASVDCETAGPREFTRATHQGRWCELMVRHTPCTVYHNSRLASCCVVLGRRSPCPFKRIPNVVPVPSCIPASRHQTADEGTRGLVAILRRGRRP